MEAYEDVRSDQTETNWCCMKYDQGDIALDSSGTDFNELREKFGDDERAFAFMRVQTGDDMSKRMKFALLCWIGPHVSALKKAKTSTEKAFVKQIFSSFAKELQFDDLHDVKEENIRQEVMKAGGANYGSGH